MISSMSSGSNLYLVTSREASSAMISAAAGSASGVKPRSLLSE